MKRSEDNVVLMRSKKFALGVIRLYDYLCEEKHEYVLSKQLLRSGTSIGANIKEALWGQSKADFGSKMNIALKEASESEYWIELLGESGKIMNDGAVGLLEDCRELIRLPIAIVKSTFKN